MQHAGWDYHLTAGLGFNHEPKLLSVISFTYFYLHLHHLADDLTQNDLQNFFHLPLSKNGTMTRMKWLLKMKESYVPFCYHKMKLNLGYKGVSHLCFLVWLNQTRFVFLLGQSSHYQAEVTQI